MHLSRNQFSKKHKYLVALILLPFICLICAAFAMTDSDDFAVAEREVLLRKIGHELLLQSGDTKSRVLPVEKITENEYQIRFENDFTFEPASLVNTTRRLLANDSADNYIVTILNCGNSSIAYGFALSKNKKDDIVACIGRKQPKACYRINIKFKSTSINMPKNSYLLVGLPFLAFVGFIFLRSGKQRIPLSEKNDANVFNLGLVVFDSKNKKLIINEQTTDLTVTETRVLLIFATSPNETIERSRLQKEIWEDEGVIVGRSLDMFISKLRKKLEIDPDIKIVVIRGKGYRLEINS